MVDTKTAIHRYAAHMRRVKYRTEVLRRCVNHWQAGQAVTGYKHTDMELCFLMLRMICESMMLAFVMVHDVFLGTLRKRIVTKAWNARKILAEIERVNPKWYPQPVTAEFVGTCPDTGIHTYRETDVPENAGWLTKPEFKKLYVDCGERLHAARFEDFLTDDAVDAAMVEVRLVTNKIITLLNLHIVQISDDVRLSVVMQTKGDGDVQVMEWTRALSIDAPIDAAPISQMPE